MILGPARPIMARSAYQKNSSIRGDLRRCLIRLYREWLVEQWQDELDRRFSILPFEIMTNDKLEAARTGNWFFENPSELICPTR